MMQRTPSPNNHPILYPYTLIWNEGYYPERTEFNSAANHSTCSTVHTLGRWTELGKLSPLKIIKIKFIIIFRFHYSS